MRSSSSSSWALLLALPTMARILCLEIIIEYYCSLRDFGP
jgi:hypothetical protein